MSKLLKLGCIGGMLFAFVAMAEPVYLLAKAELAQVLLKQAWHKSQQQSIQQKPWYWADTHPVAKIGVNQTELIVLAGMNGRNMAFGPSWMQSSAPPNQFGNTVISAHNDSHFDVLEHVATGDVISLENAERISFRYRIMDKVITDENDDRWIRETNSRMLTLITCYPFTASSDDKSQRLIIRALAI